MIDVGRFMQDGVGVLRKKVIYETFVRRAGTDTFTASGNIKFVIINERSWRSSASYAHRELSIWKYGDLTKTFIDGDGGSSANITAWVTPKSFSYICGGDFNYAFIVISEVDVD